MQNYSWVTESSKADAEEPLLAISEATLRSEALAEFNVLNRSLNRLYFNLVARAKREAAVYSRLIEEESAYLDDSQKLCFFVPYVFASGASITIQWRKLNSARGKLKETSRQISSYLKKSFKYHYGKSAFKSAPEWALPIILNTEKKFEGIRMEAEKLQEARRAIGALAQGNLACRRLAAEASGLNPEDVTGFEMHLPGPQD